MVPVSVLHYDKKEVIPLMTHYFKDQKFLLLYVDLEDGIPVSCIPRSIVDDLTLKTRVVAARGGPMSFSNYLSHGGKMKIRLSQDQKLKEIDFKEIYDHICSLTEEDKKYFLEINKEASDEVLRQMADLETESIHRLLILAENNGSPIEKPIGMEFTCFKIKEGGPELVLDFLLSRFCRHEDWEWVKRDDPKVKYCYPDDSAFNFGGPASEEKDLYKEVPVFDFSNNPNLDDLVEYEMNDDIDGDPYRSSGYYYYYSVNLKSLSILKDEIDIPWRVRQVLTSEQVSELDAEVPSILMNYLDYIARSVLMQRVDSYVEDRASQYERMRAQQWASDMYDVLGGDGEGNVYMSDGLSITPDGRIVDD